MEQDFPEIEDLCPADAWQQTVYVEHKITSADLDDLVAQFITRGGKVEQVAPGVQNATTSEYNGRIVSTSVAGITAAENQRAKAVMNRSRRAEYDAQLISSLSAMLPTELKRNEVAKALKISDHTLQRILANYFGRDARVHHIRKIERGAGSNKVKSIRDAEWLLSHGRVAEIRGVKFKRCSGCAQDKTTDQFYADNTKAAGISTRCRECERAILLERRASHEQPSAA